MVFLMHHLSQKKWWQKITAQEKVISYKKKVEEKTIIPEHSKNSRKNRKKTRVKS